MESEKNPGISRRDWLKGVAAAGAAAALSGCAGLGENARNQSRSSGSANLIRGENQRPGTRDWLLTKTRIDPATKYRCPWIEGYCSRTSVREGESISFHASTNPPAPFRIDLYRMGYYGGAGGRHMTTLGPFQGVVQSDPPIGVNRVRECRWPACPTLAI